MSKTHYPSVAEEGTSAACLHQSIEWSREMIYEWTPKRHTAATAKDRELAVGVVAFHKHSMAIKERELAAIERRDA